jgi:GT2 family glycosyltransferase
MTGISVVMPVYNAAGHLDEVLAPLRRARERGEILEIVAVDDSSDDRSPELCREAGCEVLASGGRLGPGACRNLGVERARGEWILFLDSDVIAHEDVPGRVRAAFEGDPGCVAVFGSYDARPRARGVVSRYRNLLHHFVHQNGREEASTFWAGCGAVRRSAFLGAGGFDGTRFPRPSIEDIELGYRLRRRGGRIRLDKEMQVSHLKRWTFWNMIAVDVSCRAIPWARLMMQPGYVVDDLNVSAGERGKAAGALLFWVSLVAGFLEPWIWLLSLGLLALVFAASRDFYRLVRRREGWGALLAAVFLHQLYYAYSAGAYAWCVLEHRLAGGGRTRGQEPAS